MKAGRVILVVLGVLLVVLGGVWALQGLNILALGKMAGHHKWILIGSVVAIAGLVLLVLSGRRKA